MALSKQQGAAVAAAALCAGAAFVPSTRSTPRTLQSQENSLSMTQGIAPGADGYSVGVQGSALAFSCVGLAAVAALSTAPRRGAVRKQPVSCHAFENELGVQAPVGFFDPLGMSSDGDVEDFKRRRAAELKNGRVAMFACMGYIVPEYFRFPGFLSPSSNLKFADVPNGLAAVPKVPLEGWLQWVALCGFYELCVNIETDEPGNLGRGRLGITGQSIEDPEARKRSLNSELANGRLAMVAITGMWFQNGTMGTTGPEMWFPSSSAAKSPGFNTLPEWEGVARGFEGQIGNQEPLGYWDPAGFSADGDVEKFKRRREVEIKHGRVSMLATIGYIVPEYYKFPGYLSPSQSIKFADVPNGLAALSKVPKEGLAQFAAFIAFLELVYNKPSAEPGNYGKGNLGLGSIGLGGSIVDPKARAKKLGAEISNGRLAMVAIIGMFFQDGLTGSAWGDWALYTASPLRAFDSELGATMPFKYWDPLGLASDGDAEAFRRRREAEIKNGRVAMIACMGWIVPEYYRWPGYLSPSQDIKFTDVPNGMAALSKVPADGWAQIGVFVAFLELFPLRQEKDRAPGDFKTCGRLGVPWFFVAGRDGSTSDPVASERSLNAEINNGRLAMVAITGMVFQSGMVGTTGPEMWFPSSSAAKSPGFNTLPEWEGVARGFEGQIGNQEPLGYWDPAGFSADGDVEKFKRRREVEIKHGRVSMLATIGYIVPEYYKFPGYLSPSQGIKFADVPNGLAALSKVPKEGLAQWAAFIAFLELVYNKPSAEPGNYGKGNLGLGSIGLGGSIVDPKVRAKKLGAEISNGRLAMVAIIGMFFQDGLTGSAWGDWALYTASPLRAFDSELGSTMPFKYWDPLGLASDGDEEAFRRRREAEIKNGRVAMIACMGWIVPEYYRWPGYLSPSQDIKFTDIPNGMAALSKMPADGWAQIGVFVAFLELFPLRQEKDRAPGDFKTCGRLGVPWFFVAGRDGSTSDPVASERSLNAELNNGRLAMVAITGMVFQNAVTGTTGPAMWFP